MLEGVRKHNGTAVIRPQLLSVNTIAAIRLPVKLYAYSPRTLAYPTVNTDYAHG